MVERCKNTHRKLRRTSLIVFVFWPFFLQTFKIFSLKFFMEQQRMSDISNGAGFISKIDDLMDDKGIRTIEINLKLEGCLIVLCAAFSRQRK